MQTGTLLTFREASFPSPLFFLAEGEGGKEEHHQFVHLNKNSSNTELEVGSSFNPMKD